ncbi:hypothetical protein B7463_g9250, partial [Scytalidium lignicola]
MKQIVHLIVSLAVVQCATAAPWFRSNPFEEALAKRSTSHNNNNNLQVDLGYSVYTGVHNATTGINSWKGIRFAAPPIGSLRWQSPQLPVTNRSSPGLNYADSLNPLKRKNETPRNRGLKSQVSALFHLVSIKNKQNELILERSRQSTSHVPADPRACKEVPQEIQSEIESTTTADSIYTESYGRKTVMVNGYGRTGTLRVPIVAYSGSLP